MKLPTVGDTIVGKYRLVDVIGRGGFATVYRGDDVRIERPVAVKILNPGERGYPFTTASRFKREARALAALDDPHTIRMFDYGRTEDGVLFMVFELLSGVDLSQHLSVVRTMGEEETVHIMEQVLCSLREAHAAGILHRDIKPGNIRVYEYMDDPLRAKLMDFGIVRLLDPEAESLTGTGLVVGTVRYMSPEQIHGGELTPASDLFTLALVAHEMLTGDTRPAVEVIADLPVDMPTSQGLARVLNKMLARKPGDRYQTADDVLAALHTRHDAADAPFGHDAPTLEEEPARLLAAAKANVDAPGASLDDLEPPRRGVALSPIAMLGIVALCFAVGLGIVLMFGPTRDREAPQPPGQRDNVGSLLRPEPGLRVEPIEPREAADLVATAPASADVGEGGAFDAVGSAGCGRPAKSAGETRQQALLRGLQQDTWHEFIPLQYDPNHRHPLLLLFHRDASNAKEAMRAEDVREFANDKQFLILAPDNDDIIAFRDGVDPARVERLVTQMQRRYCIDRTRVFAYGVGGGGGGVESISCEPWVAATATTAWRYNEGSKMCPQKRKVPTLYFAQMKSDYLPVDGGITCGGYETLIPLEEHEARWRQRNGCDGPQKVVLKHDDSECRTWSCDAAYVTCRIDGGHTWNGYQRREDVLGCDGPSASFPHLEVLWSFFESVRRDPTGGTLDLGGQ